MDPQVDALEANQGGNTEAPPQEETKAESWADQVDKEIVVQKVELPQPEAKARPKEGGKTASRPPSHKPQELRPGPQLVTVERESVCSLISCVDDLSYQLAALTIQCKGFKDALSSQTNTSAVGKRRRRPKRPVPREELEEE